MSDNYINWLGNNVLDPKSQPKHSRSSSRDQFASNVKSSNSNTQSPAPDQVGPPTISDKQYIPGYLTTLIGKNVRAEFVIGTSQYMDKTGILREVGANYFILEDYITHALIMCDLYSVKFITTL